MTRIRCRDRLCMFNKNGICTSDEIEYEPDMGCLTMEPREEVDEEKDKDWEEEDWEEDEEDDGLYEEDEEEDDDWEDDDEGDNPVRPRGKRK